MIETTPTPGSMWLEIVGRSKLDDFARAFADEPFLEATAAPAPIHGARAIHDFFQSTRSMYEQFAFVHEVRSDTRIYLEWAGVFRHREISGATILSRDARGAIERIRLYHFPHDQLNAFAAELRNRLCEIKG